MAMSVHTELSDYEDDERAGAPLKVLIADDHPLILAGVRRVLETCEDMDVVGQAQSGREVSALVERRAPDVVLLDLGMPGGGPELIASIRESWPEVKVVVLSASDDRASINGALGAGASSFIVKSAMPVDITSVLRQVRGGAVYHAAPAASGLGAGRVEEPEEEAGASLTSRERTILASVAAGMTTAAISKDLWISEHTIKFHLTNIYRKLGVANRASAIRYAIENGIGIAP
jgi:DNA-binding NarL/FixJ family response regulator